MRSERELMSLIKLEIFWSTLAICICLLVVSPIFLNTTYYPFYIDNILFVFVFITIMRLMIFVSTSFLSLHTYIKLIFILASASVIFYLISRLNNFNTYIDNYGCVPFLGHLSDAEMTTLGTYVINEMNFFGIGAVAASIIFPFFLVRSIWMKRNRGRHI